MKTFASKIFLLALLFITAQPILRSQSNVIVISGVIKDAQSKERVANAAISLPGTGVGTVSNSDGEFIIKVPINAVRKIIFSHISYVTKELTIENFNTNQTILLEPQVLQLSDITAKPSDALGIVKLAFEKIKQNYSEAPVMMKGFYRESIRQRRDYISITEALIDIYKTPYTDKAFDQVAINKGRKGQNIKKVDTLNVLLQGGPAILLLIDVPKNPSMGVNLIDWDKYKFKYGDLATIDEKLNYVINFEPVIRTFEPLYFGKLFIQQDNFAITRAEFSLDLIDEEKAAEMFIQKKPSNLLFVPLETNYLVTFKPYEGKYYLNYVRIDLKFKSDWKRRLFKNNYTIISEMAITDRLENNVVKIKTGNRFKTNMVMNKEVAAFYDSQFWGDQNIIEPEESIENAIKRITRKMN